jgi:hypothetical protein
MMSQLVLQRGTDTPLVVCIYTEALSTEQRRLISSKAQSLGYRVVDYHVASVTT